MSRAQAGTPGEQVALGKMLRRRGYNSSDYAPYIRPSGVLVARLANGRPRNQQALRVPDQRSPSCTGLSGAPLDCLVCHGARGWQ
jgi:hypothetical protein